MPTITVSYKGKTPKQLSDELQKYIKGLPKLIGREAVNFSKDRFRFANWMDKTRESWQPRNPDLRPGGALLVKSGRLRNSIRVINTTSNSVTIGSDVPYAEAHNEGLKGTVSVRAHVRKLKAKDKFKLKKGKSGKKKTQLLFEKIATGIAIVKPYTRQMNNKRRRFMGESDFFNRRINAIVERDLNDKLK